MANSKIKCKYCGDYFPAERMIKTAKGKFCCWDHFNAYKKADDDKRRQRFVKKRERFAQVGRKNARTTTRSSRNERSRAMENLQKLFNRKRVLEELLWFKERGLTPTCISCGEPLGDDYWSCGHYKTKASRPDLAFDPMNTYLQHGAKCNSALSGDIKGTKTTHGYQQGLINRFGLSQARAIMDYCDKPYVPLKLTMDQIQEMKARFRKEIARLQELV